MERVTTQAGETSIREVLIYRGYGVYDESVSKLVGLFDCVQGPWSVREVGEEARLTLACGARA